MALKRSTSIKSQRKTRQSKTISLKSIISLSDEDKILLEAHQKLVKQKRIQLEIEERQLNEFKIRRDNELEDHRRKFKKKLCEYNSSFIKIVHDIVDICIYTLYREEFTALPLCESSHDYLINKCFLNNQIRITESFTQVGPETVENILAQVPLGNIFFYTKAYLRMMVEPTNNVD